MNNELINTFMIDVWDCRIRSLGTWDGEYLPDALLEFDDVQEAAEEAIEAQGGAINMSGWYSSTGKLRAIVQWHLENGDV